MASKFKSGIPDNFSFDVAPVNNLGDYLDEPGPVVAKRGREVTPPAPDNRPPMQEASTVVTVPESVRTVFTPERPPPMNIDEPRRIAPVVAPPPPELEADLARAPRHTGPRREVNMSPDTLRMSDELLELIRSGSGQRDTKANELFHALVLLAHEVKDDLDLHVIPKRGRWGSPTARAYPLELKNAIKRALLKGTSE